MNAFLAHPECKSAKRDSTRSPTPSRGASACLVGALACAVAAAGIGPAAATTITLDAERNGDHIDIHASVELDADVATAWRVLTDYDRFTEFIPDLRASRIVARRGSTVTVEQSGNATLWLFKVPLEVTFEVQEIPPYRLHSRTVAGSLRGLTSSYVLTPAASGIRLEYAGRAASGYPLLGRIEQVAIEHTVARQFQALADEIERQTALARSHSTVSTK